MGTLNDANDPQEERVFAALKRLQLSIRSAEPSLPGLVAWPPARL
jgi:hypothetical protein